MKKIFFTLVCMVVMTIGAYAQQNVPAEIKEFVQGMREECASSTDAEMECAGVKIEGQDIIVIFMIDESDLEGMTMKDMFDLAGVTEKDLANMMRDDFVNGLSANEQADIALLAKYKYNLVFRLMGKQSKTQINCKLNYWEFAR